MEYNTEEEEGVVDLGLPSGTLWADKNVGAESPEDYGLYFAWGDEGYAYDSGHDFDEETYDSTTASKISGDLAHAFDMATVNLGLPWRTPSRAEIDEMLANCTRTWTTRNGVNGSLFTSNINGNSIFIPAGGVGWETYISDEGSRTELWSADWGSTYGSSERGFAYSLKCTDSTAYTARLARDAGANVRAVK